MGFINDLFGLDMSGGVVTENRPDSMYQQKMAARQQLMLEAMARFHEMERKYRDIWKVKREIAESTQFSDAAEFKGV